ncbi:hypothetical protein [Thermococcus radiotolerans]|nr:hypothetical protein [Thermococcus radiotolerans]
METAAISTAPDTITIADGREEGRETRVGHERPLFDFEFHPLEGLI